MRDCPFCKENGKVSILAETEVAYLIQVRNESVPLTGAYLIIPLDHHEVPERLSVYCRHHVDALCQYIPEVRRSAHYNINLNIGRGAGQRLAHLHFWVVMRDMKEKVLERRDELGLYSIIQWHNPFPTARRAFILWSRVTKYFISLAFKKY